jgi:hypothetical protein
MTLANIAPNAEECESNDCTGCAGCARPVSRAYAKRLAETVAMRASCPALFLPLFDHCLALAAGSYASGYPQRAGLELRSARKAAKSVMCACGAPAITGSELCASHNPDCWRIYDNGGTTADRYTVCLEVSRWEGHTAFYDCLGCSEGGRHYSEFSEAQEGRHLGKRVKLASLSPETQAHIRGRLAYQP